MASDPTVDFPVLPDGSSFFTASLPLPKEHWLYETPNDGYVGPPPMPFRMGINHPLREAVLEKVRFAAQYAIKASTKCGKENDFDPDAMIQNLLVGMFGYYSEDGLGFEPHHNPDPIPETNTILTQLLPEPPSNPTLVIDPQTGNLSLPIPQNTTLEDVIKSALFRESSEVFVHVDELGYFNKHYTAKDHLYTLVPNPPLTPLADPTEQMQTNPMFNAIYNVIKNWDINVPQAYTGYCSATGNHARAILDGITKDVSITDLVELILEKWNTDKSLNQTDDFDVHLAWGRMLDQLKTFLNVVRR